MTRLFGAILILTAFALLLVQQEPEYLEKAVHHVKKILHTKPRNFGEQVTDDLEALGDNHKLPAQWKDLRAVTMHFNSEDQGEILRHQVIRIPTKENGHYNLEIDFIDVPDEKDPGLILQYSIFDIKSKNKVWEYGETYPLKDIKGLKR